MVGATQLYASELYVQSTVLEHALGTRGFDEYGDLYRYIKVGASNVAAGKLLLAPTPKANHANLATVAAVTVDGRLKQVNVTLGATAAVAQEYAFGILNFNASSPVGETYRIMSHPAANSAANLLVTVDRPFLTNITTSSKVTLVHSPYNNAITAAVATQRLAGVPLFALTAANYAWVKTRGTASVLADGTIALGALVAASGSVAGAVLAMSDTFATAKLTTLVGQASILAGVDTEYRAIDLCID